MFHASGLHFPRLIWVKDVTFQRGNTTKDTPLYKLDWSACDAAAQKHWEEWKDRRWEIHSTDKLDPETEKRNNSLKWSCKLEEPYESLIQDSVYAINRSYMDEIHRMSMMAAMEWGMERGFDTIIRDMCLKPAIAFAECAFKLLEDCVYDPEMNYFSRKSINIVLPHALLYRFWQHQTGRGLLEARLRLQPS